MKLKTIHLTALTALLAGLLAMPALAADHLCSDVSGTIAADLTSANTAQGTVTGDLRGSVTASFTATSQSDGSISLSLHHIFITEAGDLLSTKDTGSLVPVPGVPGVYRMAVQYVIRGGAGRLAGASGSLSNHGEAVLNSSPAQLTLRYSGQICNAR